MEITVNTITLPIWPASPPDVLTEPNVQPMFLNKNYNPDPICFRMSPLPISRQVGTMVWHFWRWFIIFTPTHLIGRKSMRDEGEKTFSLHLTSRSKLILFILIYWTIFLSIKFLLKKWDHVLKNKKRVILLCHCAYFILLMRRCSYDCQWHDDPWVLIFSFL